MTVKLTQMRHFVGLAEELHFGRAAEKLGIAQPPFSQSISRLERQLGIALVNRDRHRISLTPAGEAFAREARIVLRQALVAEQTARRVNAGEVEELSVGVVEPAMFRLLPAVVLRFRERFPNVQLRLQAQVSSVQLQMLRNGKLDLAVIVPRLNNIDGVNTLVVESSPLVACVPRTSALAKFKRLKLSQLANERFIMYPPALQPHGHELIVDACRLAGFIPRIDEQVIRTFSVLRLVAAGAGISFVPATAQYSGVQSVKFLPVDDLPTIERQLMIAWRDGYTVPALQGLMDVFSEVRLDDRGAPVERSR
jgi:DNA-binding transcriptional LysR family regulator